MSGANVHLDIEREGQFLGILCNASAMIKEVDDTGRAQFDTVTLEVLT